MSMQQLQDFQRRAITAENMVKSLQQQLSSLQQELQSQKTSKRNNSQSANDDYKDLHQSDMKYQPDDTYPVWYTPYNRLQAQQPNTIKVLNSLCPSEKVPFVPKNGRKSM